MVEPIIDYTLRIYQHVRHHLTADVRRRLAEGAREKVRVCGEGISNIARRVPDWVHAAQRELEVRAGESLRCVRDGWRRARSRVILRSGSRTAWGDGDRAGARARLEGKATDLHNDGESMEWEEGPGCCSDDDETGRAGRRVRLRRPRHCGSMSMRGGAGSIDHDVSFGDGARAGAITPPPIDPGTPPPELTERKTAGSGARAAGVANGGGGGVGMDIKSQLEALTANILQNTLPLLERVTASASASLQRLPSFHDLHDKKDDSKVESCGALDRDLVTSGSSPALPLPRDDEPTGKVVAEEPAAGNTSVMAEGQGQNGMKMPAEVAVEERTATPGAPLLFSLARCRSLSLS